MNQFYPPFFYLQTKMLQNKYFASANKIVAKVFYIKNYNSVKLQQ